MESQGKPSSQDEKEKRLTVVSIVVIVILALILAGGLGYMAYVKSKDKGDDDTQAQPESSTSQTVSPDDKGEFSSGDRKTETPTATQQEAESSYSGMIPEEYRRPGSLGIIEQGDKLRNYDKLKVKFQDKYYPQPEEITNPVELGPRIEEDEDEHVDDAHTHAHNYDAADPNVASAGGFANRMAINMLSPVIAENGGYKTSVEQTLDEFGSDHAKKHGFRPWFVGEPHTDAWKSAVARGGGYIIATADRDDQELERISNDTVMVKQKTKQWSIVDDIRTPLGEQDVYLFLKQVPTKDAHGHPGSKWLIDAYSFGDSYPNFY